MKNIGNIFYIFLFQEFWLSRFIWINLATPWSLSFNRDPKNIFAHVNLGNIYLKLGDLDEAIKAYLQAEEYDKMDPEIKLNLALWKIFSLFNR